MEEIKIDTKPEEKKPEKMLIVLEVIKTPHGFDVRVTEDSVIPHNDVYIRGIFEKAKDICVGIYMQSRMQEMEREKQGKIQVVKGGGSMINGLKQKLNILK